MNKTVVFSMSYAIYCIWNATAVRNRGVMLWYCEYKEGHTENIYIRLNSPTSWIYAHHSGAISLSSPFSRWKLSMGLEICGRQS